MKIEDAVKSGYNKTTGIVVKNVIEESPAEKSGLKSEDIIVEMNRQPMETFSLFRRKLLGMAPGSKIEMTVFRQGKLVKISSVLIEKPTRPQD